MSQQPTEAAAATGVIGLGVMGHPMAANILRSGTAVHITGRSPEKYGDLIEAGAVWHDTAQSLADAVGLIVLMLQTCPRSRRCWPVPTESSPEASTICSSSSP